MAEEILSLSREESLARAALIEVERYDVVIDLRDLLEGTVWHSTCTVAFTCREPGAATFVDCVGDLHAASLNGVDLDVSAVSGGRLELTGLAERNVLVATMSQPDTGSGAGILRTVDPSDKLVYVWTSLECDEARRLWACFDQPDLKAPHGFTVTAPDSWVVTSNSAPEQVVEAEDGGRVWTFGDTPPLSTYVVVVNAGPFHEIRQERGGYSLGLYSRQSIRPFLERDAEELFELTEQGLAFFGERFGMPFPQRRYDQVFVPNMGGAMENWGCVTHSDSFIPRSEPTRTARERTAAVLLHEMAHMWFGDLVTMRWWDDLWLNEAFASWASAWASVEATRYVESWAAFLVSGKVEGYRMDMGPATHPIQGDVPTVSHAMANFDAISYLKGQSVLKQLVAYVGEDAFVEGLRTYFRRHAWGNTVLDDLLAALGEASGRDLTDWGRQWLGRAGTDTLTVADGVLVAQAPDGGEPRPHALRLGVYAGDGALDRVASVPVVTTGERTALPDLPNGDLVLPNDEDLTFAAVRPDPSSLRALLDRAGDLPDPLSRALAVTTGWDMLQKGDLSGADLVRLVVDALRTERTDGVVEYHLAMAGRAAAQWVPAPDVTGHQAVLATVCAELAEDPVHRTAALRMLATTARSPEHLALLDRAAEHDLDLAWRLLARRAELGDHDEAAVAALVERDPDPESEIRALGVLAARDDQDAKDQVWARVFHERSVPSGAPMIGLGQLFWRPGQDAVLGPFALRYLDEVAELTGGGMLALGSILRFMFPFQSAGRDFLERAGAMVEGDALLPVVRSQLLLGCDTLERMLRARGV